VREKTKLAQDRFLAQNFFSMLRTLMRAKIHRATVTRCDPDYVGSITIDTDLLAAVDIRPNERVQVLDLDNAMRIETYVIAGEAGSGIIAVNGAAARLTEVGHKVIIIAYGEFTPDELDSHVARVTIANAQNRPAKLLSYASALPCPVK